MLKEQKEVENAVRAYFRLFHSVPEQDDGVQPRGVGARGAPATGRATPHRVQPPLVLRRSRALG